MYGDRCGFLSGLVTVLSLASGHPVLLGLPSHPSLSLPGEGGGRSPLEAAGARPGAGPGEAPWEDHEAPVVAEHVLIVGVAGPGLLGQLPDALLVVLIVLVGPHEPHFLL